MSGSPVLLAECPSPAALLRAAKAAREARLPVVDALTPCAVPGLPEALDLPPSGIRPLMLAGGIAAAAGIFLLQLWYTVLHYPLNIGGRPPAAWPAYLFATFETGVLGAAAVGFVALLILCRLPQPHHPLFAAPPMARATQDGYFLLLEDHGPRLREAAAALPGVISVTEAQG